MASAAFHLPAAERRARGTLTGWGGLVCSWRRRTLQPERRSLGRGLRRSAAPTVAPQNCPDIKDKELFDPNLRSFYHIICFKDTIHELIK